MYLQKDRQHSGWLDPPDQVLCSLRICQGQDHDLFSILKHLVELISSKLWNCFGFYPLLGFSWDRTRQDDFCMQNRLLNLKPSIYAELISLWILPRVDPYLKTIGELFRLLPLVYPLGR